MHEPTRDEMQDRLVDMIHGRLAGDALASLERAVAADPALAEELALLRLVHGAMRGTPAIDVSAIVAALPAAPVTPSRIVPSAGGDDLAIRRAGRQRSGLMRFARAAAVLVVLGGGTLVAVSRTRSASTSGAVVTGAPDTLEAVERAMQLSLGMSVDELSVEQLDGLQADILALDGLPSAEPDAAGDLLDGKGA